MVPTESSAASTFFIASMMRASSPPEATFDSGRSASPTLADIRKRTASRPFSCGVCSENSQTKRIFGISSCMSSEEISRCRRCAAALRASVSAVPCSSSVFCRPESFFCSCSMRSVANSTSSSCRFAFSRNARTSSTLPPYLRLSLWSVSSRSSICSSSSAE